jgi:ribosomal protein S18
LLVWLSFIVGWTQIKRFAELSISYSLAAYEIGIVKTKANEVSDEETLSEFVNDAEQAFSREHTQWTARKQRH